MEKLYKTIAWDKQNKKYDTLEFMQESKEAFIRDCRGNGYRVNEKQVRLADEYDWIINNTNCNKWDWDIKRSDMGL
jgi:alkylated DNA repair dioxygenase AlkB